MKDCLKMLNNLDKVTPDSFTDRIIKNHAVKTLINEIETFYPEFKVVYMPGKGYDAKIIKPTYVL